jgi:hypothetical protein
VSGFFCWCICLVYTTFRPSDLKVMVIIPTKLSYYFKFNGGHSDRNLTLSNKKTSTLTTTELWRYPPFCLFENNEVSENVLSPSAGKNLRCWAHVVDFLKSQNDGLCLKNPITLTIHHRHKLSDLIYATEPFLCIKSTCIIFFYDIVTRNKVRMSQRCHSSIFLK